MSNLSQIPPVQNLDRRVIRQIRMQRGYGDVASRNRMVIGPFQVVESLFTAADPVVFAPPGVNFIDDEPFKAPFTLAGDEGAAESFRRQIRDVHIQEGVGREPSVSRPHGPVGQRILPRHRSYPPPLL